MSRVAVVFVFCFCLVFSQNLTPDDEDFSTGGILDDFLTQLERSSGLAGLVPDSTVQGINCPGYSECIINPNGTLLWDIRSDLYRTNLMQASEDETAQRTSLDGCLKYNPTDITAYQTCMDKARFEMRLYLVLYFASNFRSLIEANCSLIQENCVV